MSTILAIDPGLTTGLAYYDEDNGSFMSSTEVYGRHELYEYLTQQWLFRGASDIEVVIERWDVRKNTHQLSNQEDVRYIIGWVEGQCHMLGIPYVEQRPAEAKMFSTNDKLQKLGWYRGGEGHADDAARHLLVYLAKAKNFDVVGGLI